MGLSGPSPDTYIYGIGAAKRYFHESVGIIIQAGSLQIRTLRNSKAGTHFPSLWLCCKRAGKKKKEKKGGGTERHPGSCIQIPAFCNAILHFPRVNLITDDVHQR